MKQIEQGHERLVLLCFVIFAVAVAINPLLSTMVNNGSSNASVTTTLRSPAPRGADSTGNSNQTGDEWPMFHGALNHTGTVTTTPVTSAPVTWSHLVLGGCIPTTSPTIAGGKLFIGDNGGETYCMNAATGALIWSSKTGGIDSLRYSALAVAGNRVYFGSDDNISCLNAATGLSIWNYTTGGVTSSNSPAVANGFVYLGSSDNYLYCINATATNHTKAWSYNIGTDEADSSPAVVNGRVYVGSFNGTMFCLNAATGSKVWSTPVGWQMSSSPAVAGGYVYIGSGSDCTVSCLYANNGTVKWSHYTDATGYVYSSPAVYGSNVYVGCSDDDVYCLSVASGSETWVYNTTHPVESSPAVANGYVYVQNNANGLFCLNASNGAVVWKAPALGYSGYCSPAIAGGHVYSGSADGNVYCVPMVFTATPPSAPRNLVATGLPAEIHLTWQVPASNGGTPITDYNIYQGTSSGSETFLEDTGNITTQNIGSLLKGQTYFYRVQAVNAKGGGVPTAEANATVATNPGPVTGLSAMKDFESVFLSWTMPANNGGSAIAGYYIHYGTTSHGENHVAWQSTTNNATVYGLTPGQAYYFIVQASNAVGNSTNSTEVSATPFGPPAQVTGLSAMAGNGQVTLTWNVPVSNGGSPILYYLIFQGNASSIVLRLIHYFVGNVTQYTVPALTNGQVYYFEVNAWNAGMGPNSTEASAMPIAPPSQVVGLSVTPGNGQVTLTWNVPASNGGSPILGYNIYQGTTSGDETFLGTIGNFTQDTVGSLMNGQMYYFIVEAYNAAGNGLDATEVSAIPATTPSAVIGLTAAGQDGKVTLNWSMPASNGGSPILGYKIYQGTTSGGETYLETELITTSCTITGLSNGQTYYFIVEAYNTAGNGLNATEVAAVPATLPSVVIGVTALAQDGKVTLSWSVPASNGGSPITGYNIYQGTTSGGETFLKTIQNVLTCTITGLTNGQMYYFKVSAVNAKGEGLQSSEASATPTPSSSGGGSATPGYLVELTVVSVSIACVVLVVIKKKQFVA